MAEMSEKAKKRGKFRFISRYRRNHDESDKKRSKSNEIKTPNSCLSADKCVFLKKAASFSYFKVEHDDNEITNEIFRHRFLFKSEKDLNSFKLQQNYYLEKRLAQIRVYYSELGKSVKRRSEIVKSVQFEGESFEIPCRRVR